jgi:hypothetical protein
MTEPSETNHDAEKEIEATLTVYKVLKSLDGDAQGRIIKHVTGMLGINGEKRQ